jgi:hypothetical protein
VVNDEVKDRVAFLHHLAALISSAARPPIMKAGALVGPEVIDGMTDASATPRPRSPWTRSSLSTTASGPAPIFAVPTAWPKLAEAVRARSIRSCRLVALGPGTTSVARNAVEGGLAP